MTAWEISQGTLSERKFDEELVWTINPVVEAGPSREHYWRTLLGN